MIYYNRDSDKYFQIREATMKKFRTKLLLMFGILFFVIEGIIGVTEIIFTINSNNEQIFSYEQDLMQQYDANIKGQTESAITLLHYAYSNINPVN